MSAFKKKEIIKREKKRVLSRRLFSRKEFALCIVLLTIYCNKILIFKLRYELLGEFFMFSNFISSETLLLFCKAGHN